MEGLGRYGGCLLIHWVDAELDDGADVFGRGPGRLRPDGCIPQGRSPPGIPRVSEPGEDAVGRRYPPGADFRPGRMTPDRGPRRRPDGADTQGCGGTRAIRLSLYRVWYP